MTNRVQVKDRSYSNFFAMKKSVEQLELRYPVEFKEFVRIVRLHVTNRQSLGYNHIYRLIYGESTFDILKTDIDEITIEQNMDDKLTVVIPEEVSMELVNEYLNNKKGKFMKTVPYKLIIDGVELQVEVEIELNIDDKKLKSVDQK